MSPNNQSFVYIDGDDDAANQHGLHETVAGMAGSAAVNRGREQDGRGTGCGEDAAVFGNTAKATCQYKMDWAKSQAKRTLTEDIKNRVFTAATPPHKVYKVHGGLYRANTYKNFSVNYRRLKTKLAKSKDCVDSDRLAI
ncbi:hypothetical protein ACA910_006549 [Epithemia clementina (nom. ined.)]